MSTTKASGNSVGLGVTLVGAAVLLIATFLPLNEPNSMFRTVQNNTLIQNGGGGGWELILLALGIAASAVLYYQRRGPALATMIILCVLAAIDVFVMGSDDDSRTLYPVRLDGSIDTTNPTV